MTFAEAAELVGDEPRRELRTGRILALLFLSKKFDSISLAAVARLSSVTDTETLAVWCSAAVHAHDEAGWLAAVPQQDLQQGQLQGRLEGYLESYLRGVLEGTRKVVLWLLSSKFGGLAPEVEARVHAADERTLEAWAAATLTASSVDDVLDTTP